MLTLTGDAAGIGSFNSTISNSVNDFDMLFDFERQNRSMDPNSVPGLRELLAARYQIARELPQSRTAVDMLTSEGVTYYVIEEPACPIGFAQSSYITEEELKQLPVNKRGIAMLDNLVVSDSDEGFVAEFLEHNDHLSYAEDGSEMSALVSRNQEHGVSGFKRDQTGFGCAVALDDSRAVFFSVPYDDGWTALVDGEKREILSSGGMMALLLEPGEYDISFQYKVPGLRTGVLVSVICFCVFGMVVWFERGQKSFKEAY